MSLYPAGTAVIHCFYISPNSVPAGSTNLLIAAGTKWRKYDRLSKTFRSRSIRQVIYGNRVPGNVETGTDFPSHLGVGKVDQPGNLSPDGHLKDFLSCTNLSTSTISMGTEFLGMWKREQISRLIGHRHSLLTPNPHPPSVNIRTIRVKRQDPHYLDAPNFTFFLDIFMVTGYNTIKWICITR
jgi:hypothetical protein